MRFFKKLLSPAPRAVVVEPEPIDPRRYRPTHPDSFGSVLQMTMKDLDGVSWYDAGLPPENHVCWVQTTAYDSPYVIERCACGAISMRRRSESTRWAEKNSTLKSKSGT